MRSAISQFIAAIMAFAFSVTMLNAQETRNLSHDPRNLSFGEAKQSLVDKIQQRGDLAYITVERQLELLDQLSQFELGQFLIERAGLNGFWTHYIITHPLKGRLSGLNQHNEPFHSLESFILDRAPVCLATQQRFVIFKAQIQKHLHEGCSLASIPSGLMADLLDLDFSTLATFSLHGIDLDLTSLSQAYTYAKEKKLEEKCDFSQHDAWNLEETAHFDLIVSNGLNIYEPDDEKVIELYRQFFKHLTSQGILVTSFLTPPPAPGLKTEWKLDQVNPDDALMQKIIFGDILSTKWQVFRSEETVLSQLRQAGFDDIQIFYDAAHMFPTVVAKKK